MKGEDDGTYPKEQWRLFNQTWYYFDKTGYMATGWRYIDENRYFLNEDGSMAANTWIGDYYVKSDGVMAVNEWIGDDYVDKSGKWVDPSIPSEYTVTQYASSTDGQSMIYAITDNKGNFVLIDGGY